MKKDKTEPRIALLGATGSIGRQTLSVAESLGATLDVMTAGSRDREFEEQCRRFRPRVAAMADAEAARRLKTALADTDITVYGGSDGVAAAAAEARADSAVVAISGMAACEPMIEASRCCRRICMANKEAIVAAGAHLLKAIKEGGAELIPVDSEHSAIFQSLSAGRRGDVEKLLLTASGGPFYGKKRSELEKLTVADALAHPTWAMGPKITVDSATLMNKGFEVIEAAHLFSVPASKIEVVVHRESIIHSMVEFRDHAIIAQLGVPDMRTAIAYAITYPAREPGCAASVDWRTLSHLTFGVPDFESFPLLAFAFNVAGRGGTCPAVMSAADEVAVSAFLRGEIGFTDIFDVVMETVDAIGKGGEDGEVSFDEIVAADAESRIRAAELTKKHCGRERV